MAIADYLRKLVELKNQLVANLNSMGVTADENEKLNTLVPKVLQCETKQNVEFIESTTFTSLQGNVKKVTIPDSVTTIGNQAFRSCTSLASITIPDSVTSIGYEAFRECTSLAGVTIPAGVTSIGDYVFYKCTSLASITIPDSVTSIGDNTFRECTSLAGVTIGNGVTSIGNNTFSYCTSLASITIPDSVTSIGDYVFSGCTSLANIYYKGTEKQWNAITKGNSWNKNMGSNVSGGTVIHYNYVPE